ncbi:MAG: DUF6464 family protein [Nostoc sp.]|uniref:DUF6464 family protein n=1 Tax=Nostoc sp. TaxID=1180 RepID=UPI002FF4AADF
MKKFDWFTILGAIAITENTICFIIQGGWLTVMGLIFGGIWVWVAYWDWRNRRITSSLDTASRSQSADIHSMCDVFRQINRAGVTIDEFSSTLNNACQEPHSIGDVGCKWNARSPHLRCAINPSGECQGCKDYEKL